ncbi:MAG TPA: Ig-like domain-containing protein [Longimicrobium sp.]|nr:Ig-like domain-containing protein [Longimicrobium sp.]
MRKRQYLALALAAALSACGGGGAATGPGDGGNGGGGGGNSNGFASLNLNPASGTVEVGGTFQLNATPVDGSGNTVNGLPAPTYESADAAKATVDGTGLVRGVAAGPVVIRAILAAGGKTDTATASLTVVPAAGAGAAFTSLAVTPDFGTVPVGGTLTLTATPKDQSGQAMTGLPAAVWSTSDASRATVANGGVVTGHAAGTVTVTARVTHGGVTREAAANVTVTQQTPGAPSTATVDGIEDAFSPSAVTIAAGGTVTWTMTEEEHDVTWSGNAPPGGNIPRIDDDEPVSRTFPAAGTYTYTCERHDGEHGGTVEVKTGQTQNPVFTAVTLSPASPSVQVGTTLQLTATPRDQNGLAMSGLPAATFASSDPAKATVSATGLVTGVAAGTATVTATVTSGGTTRTATATVTVTTTPTQPQQPSTATVTTSGVRFVPADVTIAAGGTVTWRMAETRHNVTFSGAAPTGGNIPDTDEGGSASRTFPTAGTYTYTCTRHSGMNGRVIVQ